MNPLKDVLFEVKEGIAYVTINRPQALNALTAQVIEDLCVAVAEIRSNDAIRAAIITGAGEKAFVAGADINQFLNLNPLLGKKLAERGQTMLREIETACKPIVAAVNGFALGGGCEIALACHMRTASSKAKFGQPEVNLGIIPGYGGTQRLPRLVGKARAIEMILTGCQVTADEALHMGLANKVFAPEELMLKTEELVRTILSKGPVAVRLSLEAINRGCDMPLAEGMALEANLFGLVCATDDLKEGAKAFLEKRKANFQGK